MDVYPSLAIIFLEKIWFKTFAILQYPFLLQASSFAFQCSIPNADVYKRQLLLRVGLLAPMMAIAGLIFSASTGGKVSFVLLFAIPVLLIVLTIIMIFASRYSIRLRRKLDHINHLFLETLEGVRVISCLLYTSF